MTAHAATSNKFIVESTLFILFIMLDAFFQHAQRSYLAFSSCLSQSLGALIMAVFVS